MGTPKIKIYQLPRGYSEAGDNDVQQVIDDEIVPIVDKPLAPEDFYLLTGIKWVTASGLYPINYAAGEYLDSLLPPSGIFQYPSAAHTDIFIVENSRFTPIVYTNSMLVIAPSGYTLTASGVYFTVPPSGAAPSGAYIRYWRQDTEPCTAYTGLGPSGWYNGTNHMFPSYVYASGIYQDITECTIVHASGLVLLSSPKGSITASYTYPTNITKYFIGDHENWIDNHIYLRPDIFKGMYNYPGDDSEDQYGTPIVQGLIPQFVENANYQLDFRKGLVTFTEEFNSITYPVHASYAYMINIRNVTGQVLDQISADPSGGYVYKAVTDKFFPLSINTSWLKRNDSYTPRNFYIDGTQKPQLVTITPYDVLTVKNE